MHETRKTRNYPRFDQYGVAWRRLTEQNISSGGIAIGDDQQNIKKTAQEPMHAVLHTIGPAASIIPTPTTRPNARATCKLASYASHLGRVIVIITIRMDDRCDRGHGWNDEGMKMARRTITFEFYTSTTIILKKQTIHPIETRNEQTPTQHRNNTDRTHGGRT